MLNSVKIFGYQTHLAILSFEGRVEDKGNYIVAESFGNPGYFWGNLLVMKEPPKKGDFQDWLNAFQNEFSHEPLVKHVTFGWDTDSSTPYDASEFIEDGFLLEQSVDLLLTPSNLREPKHKVEGLEIRPLVTDDEWNTAIDLQIICRDPIHSEEHYRNYKTQQMAKFRRMCAAGLGHWFGAYLGTQLVGDCGLFVFGDVGRYQMVGTHPDFRRRGICGNLISTTAKFAFSKQDAKTLVIVADPDYHASQVYQSVGFKPSNLYFGIRKYPQDL